ncbi:hypothetical protein Y032_0721g1821 [Ancylostoma ceylanicum]|uniref:Uncharacterized protein n=1 Tax=Ancylostoma ceylanicum TaxID=53326 RepID=A0A016WEV7_9BILA|nr:hypothetical protein Y032_0721g1821 [Ancylostoma ceylanicum]
MSHPEHGCSPPRSPKAPFSLSDRIPRLRRQSRRWEAIQSIHISPTVVVASTAGSFFFTSNWRSLHLHSKLGDMKCDRSELATMKDAAACFDAVPSPCTLTVVIRVVTTVRNSVTMEIFHKHDYPSRECLSMAKGRSESSL